VDREGMPLSATTTAANGSKREQVLVLIESVAVLGRPENEANRPKE